MRRDVDLFCRFGIDGLAIGALDDMGDIDPASCRHARQPLRVHAADFSSRLRLLPQARGSPGTDHRRGLQRVLTSGAAETALQGASCIAKWPQAGGRGQIEILPAGGINAANGEEVIVRTGCDQVHASLRRVRCTGVAYGMEASLSNIRHLPDDAHEETDEREVRALKERLVTVGLSGAVSPTRKRGSK